MKPWLSILIPTYNGEDYLPSALDSIIAQGDRSIECIVVDDGSTDSTLAILESYANRLPIRVFQRKRGNWVTNTNYALSVACADYVCFLHQDDLWLGDRLKKMKGLIEQYPQANLYLHASVFIDTQGKRLGVWQCPYATDAVIDAQTAIEKLLIQNFIAIPAPIFRREAALRLGGMDEQLWYTADWDFWLKLAALGTVYLPEPLAAFRVHANSQTMLRSASLPQFQEQLHTVLEKHLNGWEASENVKQKTRQVAFFSTDVNTTLAAIIHGKKVNSLKLLSDFLSLGPDGWHQYLRDSRIRERVLARLKAKLQAHSSG